MAIFHVAQDGHFFVRQGYSILDEQDEDRVATYQVAPRGERIFEYLQWRGGEQVDLLLFTALRVEGALLNSRYPDACSVLAISPTVKRTIVTAALIDTLNEVAEDRMLKPNFTLDRVIAEFVTGLPDRRKVVHLGSLVFLLGKFEEARRRLRAQA